MFRVPAATALFLVLAACPAPHRGPAAPSAEFVVEDGDSSFWVRSGPEGVRVRSAPLRLGRLNGSFIELYLANDDHSYPDGIITGQRLYRRDLRSGDSTAIFMDTTINAVAVMYASQHPTERPLGPDDDLPEIRR